jgi:RNA recognition motif-containing protein
MENMPIPEDYDVSLFVGDLSSFCDEEHIKLVFETRGFEVVEAKLMRGHRSMSSLNYGFVKLRSNEEAARAISMLDNMLVYGRKIRVNWASPNKTIDSNEKTINAIYVKFQTFSVNNN